MIKQPVRNRFVERLPRIGDASMHEIGAEDDITAKTYHYHNNVEVIIVRRGWADGLVGEMTGRLHQGMTVVLGSDVPHCILRASEKCAVLLVHIPYGLLKWDADEFPELTHGIDFIRTSKSGILYDDAEFANKLARLADKIAAAEGFMRMSLLMRMLHILSTTAPTATLKAEQHATHGRKTYESPIDRIYIYLYRHFREQLSLSSLAAYSGLSPAALCRAFKKASGYTIGQFCSRLSIEHACKLLLTTGMDVAQIAYRSGYNSYPHFCTQFKNTMNMTPTEYRAMTDCQPKQTICEQEIASE